MSHSIDRLEISLFQMLWLSFTTRCCRREAQDVLYSVLCPLSIVEQISSRVQPSKHWAILQFHRHKTDNWAINCWVIIFFSIFQFLQLIVPFITKLENWERVRVLITHLHITWPLNYNSLQTMPHYLIWIVSLLVRVNKTSSSSESIAASEIWIASGRLLMKLIWWPYKSILLLQIRDRDNSNGAIWILSSWVRVMGIFLQVQLESIEIMKGLNFKKVEWRRPYLSDLCFSLILMTKWTNSGMIILKAEWRLSKTVCSPANACTFNQLSADSYLITLTYYYVLIAIGKFIRRKNNSPLRHLFALATYLSSEQVCL